MTCPARTLADQLREESPDSEIVTEDGLRAMGRGFVLVNEKAAGRRVLPAAAAMAVGRDVLAVRRVRADAAADAGGSCTRFGSRGVLRLVRRVRPDVIVSVYPMTTEVLGKLRRTRPARHPRRRGDHRPGGDALLGRAGSRPAPRDSSRVDRGGARGRRCGLRRRRSCTG